MSFNDILNATLEFLSQMFVYIMIGALLENTIFSRGMGSSTSLWIIRKKYNVFLFGAILTLVITLASIAASFVVPLFSNVQTAYLWLPLTFVGIIAILYIVLILMANRLPITYRSIVLMFIHRCAFNGAVFGALLLAWQKNIERAEFIGFGIGAGIGFTIATYLIYISYEKLNSLDIPKSFRGFPVTMIYMGIISLAVYGLIGHELPI